MSRSKLGRLFAAAFVAAGLTVIPAWSALAVTNPADNPHPITVIGDDGNTYHDGADTLPGYDDEECTYIPGAYFDFAANRVRYADGQSIPWTEWDRASGYREWLATQSSSSGDATAQPTDSNSSNGNGGGTKDANGNNGIATGETNELSPTEVATDSVPVAESQLLGSAPLAFGLEANSNPGRETGLVILAFLFGTGAVITVVHALRQRLQQGGTN